jgi:tRNA(fMet)-specific endonuclease VapC
MGIVFDTNIIIDLIRAGSRLALLEARINPNQEDVFISIVTVAEARTFAINASWGQKRIDALELLLGNCTVINISDAIVTKYVEIDTYNGRKNPYLPILAGNPINMGKNDIWIASTASLLDATLVTTDKDFQHLHNVFVQVDYVPRDAQGAIVL